MQEVAKLERGIAQNRGEHLYMISHKSENSVGREQGTAGSQKY
jgi:hypothetical protein